MLWLSCALAPLAHGEYRSNSWHGRGSPPPAVPEGTAGFRCFQGLSQGGAPVWRGCQGMAGTGRGAGTVGWGLGMSL